MNVNENRKCNCSCDMKEASTTASNMDNSCERDTLDRDCSCKIECECECNCNCGRNCQREEMIEQIRCYEFTITELALYLDTHPDDQKALFMHREYCKKSKDLKDKYQKVYGPLTINFPCNKWRWLEEPWPWERGNY